jgi:hypothetical protein
MFLSTASDMSSLSPDPGFEYYYKACRKGDPEAKAVAVSYSPIGVLADECIGATLSGRPINLLLMPESQIAFWKAKRPSASYLQLAPSSTGR